MKEYLDQLAPKQPDAVGNETFYLFGNHYGDAWDSFLAMYHRIPCTNLEFARESALSFGISNQYSGVPFHVHGAVFAQQLHGRKAWLMAQPGEGVTFDTELSPYAW